MIGHNQKIARALLLLAGAALTPLVAAAEPAGDSSDDGAAPTVVVTANRRTENFQTAPLAATVFTGDDLRTKSINTVEDLQFLTPSLTVSNFGGGYDFNIRGIGRGEDGGFDIGFPFGAVDYVLQSRDLLQSEAAFGQVTYDLSPAFQVQAGARYSHSTDDVTANYNYLFGGFAFTPPSVVPCVGPSATCPITNPGHEDDSKVTEKLSLNWKPNENNYFYLFFATGHKAGGVNAATNQPPIYRPEDVNSAEIGWKPTLADGHLRGQFDAYWNDYKNFQVTLYDPQTLSSPVLNAPSAQLWGFEAQMQGAWKQFSFNLNAAYEHTAFGTFYAAPAAGLSGTTCDPHTGGTLSTCQNLSHEALVMAPQWSFGGSAQYAFDIGAGAKLTPRISYSYMGSQFPTVFHDVANGGVPALGARNLVNAQLSYDVKSWDVTAFATNLTDAHIITYQDSTQRHAAPPRQFGVRVLTSF